VAAAMTWGRVKTHLFDATEMGWNPRPDLGPDIWESPNGRLWQAKPDQVPMFMRMRIEPDQPTTEEKPLGKI
jgi:hypothetical protein